MPSETQGPCRSKILWSKVKEKSKTLIKVLRFDKSITRLLTHTLTHTPSHTPSHNRETPGTNDLRKLNKMIDFNKHIQVANIRPFEHPNAHNASPPPT
jgi:hypothetical protein